MLVKFNPLQFHHLYVGVIMMIISLIISERHKKCITFWTIVFLLGLMVAVDDFNQHFMFGGSLLHPAFTWLWAKVFGTWWPFGSL